MMPRVRRKCGPCSRRGAERLAVARLGIDDRDRAIRRCAHHDAPAPRHLGIRRRRPATTPNEPTASAASSPNSAPATALEDRQRVADEGVDEIGARCGVAPVALGLGAPGVITTATAAASGINRRQRRICAQIRDGVLGRDRVIHNVESNARRPLSANTPVCATTARTASKTRSGRSLRRRRARHNVNTRMEPPISQRQTRRRLPTHIAPQPLDPSRSEVPSNAWSTNTTAITDAGWDRRPRPENKAANNSSGNTAVLRQEPIHRPLRDQIPTHRQSVQQFGSSRSEPCIPPFSPTPHPTRAFPHRRHPELLSSLLGGWCQMGWLGVWCWACWWFGAVWVVVGLAGVWGWRLAGAGLGGSGGVGFRRGPIGWVGSAARAPEACEVVGRRGG